MPALGLGLSSDASLPETPGGPAAPDLSDTSLTTFTVEGSPVVDNATPLLPTGTANPTIVATPVVGATADPPIGGTGLAVGENAWSMLVTAADGVTTHTYHLSLDVAPDKSSITSLTQHADSNQVDMVYAAKAGATAYEYRIDGGAPILAGGAATTENNIVTPIGNHDFEIRAMDGFNNKGDWSDIVSIDVHAIQLDQPQSLSLDTSSSGAVGFDWANVTLHPLGYRTRYELNTAPSGDFDTTGTHENFAGFTTGDSITCYVKTLGDGNIYLESLENNVAGTVS